LINRLSKECITIFITFLSIASNFTAYIPRNGLEKQEKEKKEKLINKPSLFVRIAGRKGKKSKRKGEEE